MDLILLDELQTLSISPIVLMVPSRQSSRSFLALSLHIPFVFFNQKHFLSRLKQYR